MELLKFGEVAVLEDGKEYISFCVLDYKGNSYVYLMSNFKPLEVKIASQKLSDGKLELHVVDDMTLKQELLEEFQNKMGKKE